MAHMADATPEDAREIEQGRGLDRVIAFSDGVFAIAITLLVLNFKLPHVHSPDIDRKLFEAIYGDWGLWLSFSLSFFIIARFWIAHHRLSLLLRRIDQRFIVLNLVLLAFVVTLPYPTEVFGEYNERTSTVFYALAMTLTGLASAAVWQYAQYGGLMDPRVSPQWIRHGRVRSAILPIVFGISIPIAFVSTEAAHWVWGLLFFQGFITRRYGDIHQPYASGDG
jgi:uncharacterized membrane protein